jgi:hypothetical protein
VTHEILSFEDLHPPVLNRSSFGNRLSQNMGSLALRPLITQGLPLSGRNLVYLVFGPTESNNSDSVRSGCKPRTNKSPKL